MEEKVRAARAEYMRSWRAKNKDKVKIIQDRYWTNKANKFKCEGDRK